MTIPVHLLLVSIASLVARAGAIEPQECPGPNEWFTAEFASIVDVLLPVSEPFVMPDVNLEFLREIMHFTEDEITDSTEDAIAFFKTRYGLDFSVSQPNELQQRFFENATFAPYQFNPAVHYTVTFHRWIINGHTRSICFANRDGGFQVTFQAESTVYGTYGGPEGKPIRPHEAVVWGFYNIPVCLQQPLVIHYESASPFRTEPVDGISIINCHLDHRELGLGSAQGLAIVTPTENPGIVHWSVRNLFTFPRNPGLP